jgi:hypothetical protein
MSDVDGAVRQAASQPPPTAFPPDPESPSIHDDKTGAMRPGQNKRSRGRNGGGGPPHGGGGPPHGGGGPPHGGGSPPHHNNRPRLPHRVQTFDSNGPNVKIRGNAYQVFERYVALAREAQTSGDRVAAENLYQHAEHYFRMMNLAGEGQGQGPPRPTTPADLEMGGGGDGETRDGEARDGEEAEIQSAQPPYVPSSGDDQPPSY